MKAWLEEELFPLRLQFWVNDAGPRRAGNLVCVFSVGHCSFQQAARTDRRERETQAEILLLFSLVYYQLTCP